MELAQSLLDGIEMEKNPVVRNAKTELMTVILGLFQAQAITSDEFNASQHLIQALLDFRDPDLRNRLAASWLSFYKSENKKTLETWIKLRPTKEVNENVVFSRLIFSPLIAHTPTLEKNLSTGNGVLERCQEAAHPA